MHSHRLNHSAPITFPRNSLRNGSSNGNETQSTQSGQLNISVKFSLWCMNPAVAMQDLSRTSHAVILTSGTLSPLDSFSSELGMQFKVQIEAPAVVDTRRQVWAGVLPSAPPLPGNISQASSSSAASPKLLLNGTFKHATTLLYQAGLSSDVIIGAPACPRVAPPGGRSGAPACVNSRGYRMGPSLNGRIQRADQSDP